MQNDVPMSQDARGSDDNTSCDVCRRTVKTGGRDVEFSRAEACLGCLSCRRRHFYLRGLLADQRERLVRAIRCPLRRRQRDRDACPRSFVRPRSACQRRRGTLRKSRDLGMEDGSRLFHDCWAVSNGFGEMDPDFSLVRLTRCSYPAERKWWVADGIELGAPEQGLLEKQ